MSLLLSQQAAPFNPGTDGFPYQQQPGPPAHNVARRCAALLLTAAVTAPFQPPAVNPADVPTWLPNYPDQPMRATPRATGLRQNPLSKSPDQFIGSVRNQDIDTNTGLRITTNLVSTTVNYTVKCFFYISAAPDGGDHNIWMWTDGGGYHTLQLSAAGDLFWANTGGPFFFDAINPIQRNRWWGMVVSVGNGSANFYYKPVSAPGAPLTDTVGGVNNHTPTEFCILDDPFVEPFNGRMAGVTIWQGRQLTEAEATLELQQLAPVHTANVSHYWPLASAATRQVELAFGRNFSDFGAGTWLTEEGPFLQAGALNPALGFPYEQPPSAPPAAPRSEALLDGGGGLDWTFAPAGFDPGSSPSWLPQYPDSTRDHRRAVAEGRTVVAPLQVQQVDPSLVPTWLPQYPDFAARGPLRATGLWQSPLSQPPSQFVGSLRFDSNADRLGRPTDLPPYQNFTVSMWARLRVNRAADSTLFGIENVDSSATVALVTDNTGADLAFWAGFADNVTVGTLEIDKWAFVAISSDGSMLRSWFGGPNLSVPLVANSAATTFTFTPTKFFVGGAEVFGNKFFNGDIAGLKIWNTAFVSTADLEAERRKLLPVRTADINSAFLLESDATKLIDNTGQGRNLVAAGAGPWQTEEGPFLLEGAFDPSLGFPYEQPPSAPPAAPRSHALLDGGGGGDFVFTPAPPDQTVEWLPSYPDFPARAALRPVDEGGVFWTHLEREPLVDWLPTYPDFARAAERPVNEGGVFRTHVEYEPSTDWAPEYPDFPGRGALRPVDVGGGAEFVKLEREPQLDWAPTYPDFARAAERPVNEGGLVKAPFTPAGTADSLWYPRYPDFALGRQPIVLEGGVSWTYFEREPITDWLPTYPDFARAARRPVNVGGYTNTIQPSYADPAALDWLPRFPDFIEAPPRPVDEGAFSFDNFDFVPKLSWTPVFPDPLPVQPRPEGGLTRPPSADLTPDLSWSPTYPDFARAALRPLNVGGLVRPPLSDLTPALAWAPQYPDFAWAARRPINEGGGVSPVAPPRAPDLEWLPTFPDFARAAARPVNTGGSFFTRLVALEPLTWQPTYPSFATAHTRRPWLTQFHAHFSANFPRIKDPVGPVVGVVFGVNDVVASYLGSYSVMVGTIDPNAPKIFGKLTAVDELVGELTFVVPTSRVQ